MIVEKQTLKILAVLLYLTVEDKGLVIDTVKFLGALIFHSNLNIIYTFYQILKSQNQ